MSYEAKWLVTEALPFILVFSVLVVLAATRVLQYVQRTVFKVLPFGAVGELNLIDVCIGVTITGSYYLYFRTYRLAERPAIGRSHCPRCAHAP